MRIRHSIFFVGLTLLLSLSVTLAQDTACPALVQQALSSLGGYCDTLDRNSACYGFNRLDTTFSQAEPDNYFSQPADRAGLAELETIHSAPLNTDTQEWGLAVMNIQANLPGALPGQAVVMILVGDVSLENQVSSDQAIPLGNPVTVTTLSAANIRSGPATNTNIVVSAPRGSELSASGQNSDGSWLQVAYGTNPGWISRSLVDSSGDLSTLPVITSRSLSPMQAFTFHTSLGQPSCQAAPPSVLLLQGPEHIAVTISANGAEMRFGSTILLWQIGPDEIAAGVLDGALHVGGLNVPPGFIVQAKIDPDTGEANQGWGSLHPMPFSFLQQLQPLTNIPANLLHYPITIPTEGDIQAFLASVSRPQTQPEATGEATAPVTSGDCGSFVNVAPLSGMPFDQVTFVWTAVNNAQLYRVNIFDEGGTFLAKFDVAAPRTSTSESLAFLQLRPALGWNVQAWGADGSLLCTTPLVVEQRSSQPAPSPIPPPVTTPDVSGVG
jgi:SH3 domain-containing protein